MESKNNKIFRDSFAKSRYCSVIRFRIGDVHQKKADIKSLLRVEWRLYKARCGGGSYIWLLTATSCSLPLSSSGILATGGRFSIMATKRDFCEEEKNSTRVFLTVVKYIQWRQCTCLTFCDDVRQKEACVG